MENSRILLVEDNATNVLVAKSLLRKLGTDPVVVMDGLEAVEATLQVQYDLIFMDCMMPVMDGYEATENIRLNQENPNNGTTIVGITANILPEDLKRCDHAGMNEVMAKPVSFKKFEYLLEKWLTRSPSRKHMKANHAQTVSKFEGRVFNRDLLIQNFGDSIEFIEEIVKSLETTVVEQLDKMGRAISGIIEFSELRESAHRIRGASGNCGAERLELIASDLEFASNSEDSEKISVLYPQLKIEAKRLNEKLRGIDWSDEIDRFGSRN